MQGEMSLAELRRLVVDVAGLKARKLVFTGGEPMLRADLFEAAAAFRQTDAGHHTRLCLITNGLLIDGQTAAKITESFDEVRISIDGPEEVNDRLRGCGSFGAALLAMRSLRDAGLAAGVSVTVTALNLPHLVGFLSFLLDEERVTDFHLAPFRYFGRGAGHPELLASWREAQEAVATFWRPRFGDPSNLVFSDDHSLVECGTCGVGTYINVHPDGTVYPCRVLSIPRFCLGNVNRDALPSIIENSQILRWLRELDFLEPAAADGHLAHLLEEAMCVGEILPLLLADRRPVPRERTAEVD